LEDRQNGLRVLKDERSIGIGDAECGVEGVVGAGDLDLTLAGKWLGRSHREHERVGNRQVVLAGELDAELSLRHRL
jgi:hypothetical protein